MHGRRGTTRRNLELGDTKGPTEGNAIRDNIGRANHEHCGGLKPTEDLAAT